MKLAVRQRVLDASSNKFTTFIGTTRFRLSRALPLGGHTRSDDCRNFHDPRSARSPKHHLPRIGVGPGTWTWSAT